MLMWTEMAMVFVNSAMKMICTMLYVNWMTLSSPIDMIALMFAFVWKKMGVEADHAVALEIAIVVVHAVVVVADHAVVPPHDLVLLLETKIVVHDHVHDRPVLLVTDPDPDPDRLPLRRIKFDTIR